jgi:hypothetical protein
VNRGDTDARYANKARAQWRGRNGAVAAAGGRAAEKRSSTKRSIVGWTLDSEQRSWLLNLFSSAYPT